MGPFSNNNVPPPPPSPRDGTKLPTPDVVSTPQQTVVIEPPQDQKKAVKKWFTISMWIAGSMPLLGVIVFAAYLVISNSPSYMLGVAMNNVLTSSGEAGNIAYETTGKNAAVTSGDFLIYADPADPNKSSVNVSLGQNASRVSAAARLTQDTDYVQTAGLGNLKRLIDHMRGDSSRLNDDKLVRLSSLDNQWYSLTADDTHELRDSAFKPAFLKAALSPAHFQAIAHIYQKNQFIKILQQYGDEKINTIPSMHLRIGVDKSMFAAFLHDLKVANIDSVNLTDADVAALQHFSFDPYTIEVWISRDDKTFQQWRLTAKQPDGTATTTVNFKPDEVATQRQAVIRPDSTQSISILVNGLNDILFDH